MAQQHEHDFVKVVRERGTRVRKQCLCKHIGPWVKVMKDVTPIPSRNPAVLRTLTLLELQTKAKAEGIRGYSKMRKDALIEALTEVKA